jgi:hypothetical protein
VDVAAEEHRGGVVEPTSLAGVDASAGGVLLLAGVDAAAGVLLMMVQGRWGR